LYAERLIIRCATVQRGMDNNMGKGDHHVQDQVEVDQRTAQGITEETDLQDVQGQRIEDPPAVQEADQIEEIGQEKRKEGEIKADLVIDQDRIQDK